MDMAVNADESQLEPEYESDWEEASQDKGEESDPGEPEAGPSHQTKPTKPQMSSCDKHKKIQKLDVEMRVRMVELHSMMKKQGLDDSAEVLQQCMDLEPRGKSKQRTRHSMQCTNINTNASLGTPTAGLSNSN